MSAPPPAAPRDRWLIGGAALLALLTLAVAALYLAAPQSAREAATRAWVAARPSAYQAQYTRAQDLARAGERAAAQGNDLGAMAADSAAADHAWQARTVAGTAGERQAATELWAAVMLHHARALMRAGRQPWWRADDAETLRAAQALVRQVLAVQTSAGSRAAAAALGDTLDRALRPGPLEWLPLPR